MPPDAEQPGTNQPDDNQPVVKHPTPVFKLPTKVVGPTEVNRLWHELRNLEDFFDQLTDRQPNTIPKLPRTSRLLDELASINNFNLLEENARRQLDDFLILVKRDSPVIHISFASEPSAAFTEKFVGWMRENIHPSLLILFGLEPSIAAGCIVRTAKRQYDFSLRQRFMAQRQTLVDLLTQTSNK